MKVTADDIAQLLASAPPRLVPAHVAQAARGGSAPASVALFGLLFGSFGMIFVVVFFPWQFWNEGRLALGPAQTVTGIVTNISRTNMRINRRQVMEYQFAYTPENSPRLQGDCFSTNGNAVVGGRVSVRYLVAAPAVACIEDMRLSQAGWMGAWVVIFPAVGFGLVGWVIRQRGRTGRLLREGLTAEVDVLAVEPTQTQVNNRTVYRIMLSAPAPGGPPVKLLRVNQAEIELARRQIEQKRPVFVLYDPRKPSRLVLPEALIDAGP